MAKMWVNKDLGFNGKETLVFNISPSSYTKRSAKVQTALDGSVLRKGSKKSPFSKTQDIVFVVSDFNKLTTVSNTNW